MKPTLVRLNVWVFGILGLWSTIGSVAPVAARSWGVAALTFATGSLSTVSWWVLREARRKAPATQRWIDELQLARGSEASE